MCFGQVEKLVVTLNPLSFIEPQAGFTPGIGYHFNEKWSIYSDLGVVFYNPYDTKSNLQEKILGYKFKPALRYYFIGENRMRKKVSWKGTFLEIEGLLKNTTTTVSRSLAIFDNNGNFVYNYLGGWKNKRTIYGASLKVGSRQFIGNENRFGFDTYFGIGIRSGFQKNKGVPNGATISLNGLKFDAYGGRFRTDNVQPSFPLGIKFFYVLKQRRESTAKSFFKQQRDQ